MKRSTLTRLIEVAPHGAIYAHRIPQMFGSHVVIRESGSWETATTLTFARALAGVPPVD